MAPMKIERCRFTLNVIGELLYAVGGSSEADEYDTSTCECYNPIVDSWYMIQPLPAYVSQHAGAGYENNYVCRLYISGGIDRDNVQVGVDEICEFRIIHCINSRAICTVMT